MKQDFEVSVIMCTYNRAAMLAPAIESILNQETGGIRFEFVVVDNNSIDETRAVIESYISRGENIRYLFEGKQGSSNARIAGTANTTAPILAFTDDDVRVQPNWVEIIKKKFDEYPDVAFVGGKVLPDWEATPPDWLTRDHWAPLALVDYGDEPFQIDMDRAVCLVSANLAIRRRVLEEVGSFRPEFVRIGPSSCEDHELELRILRAGRKGLYVPELVISAAVQKERLLKRYHRNWHSGHGKSMALMNAYETLPPTSSRDAAREVKLFDSPAYLYRDLVSNLLGLLKATIKREESDALFHESRIRDIYNYIRTKRQNMSNRSPMLFEFADFAAALAQKKISRNK